MPQSRWMSDPDSGGKKIPEAVKREVTGRIERYAAEHYAGQYTRLDVRFRGQFCYIDAYTEPTVAEGWPPEDWPETREEHIERLRNTPTHLCRLRYFGNDSWGFAFYSYASMSYKLSMYDDGSFFGKPEDAFEASAMYLQ